MKKQFIFFCLTLVVSAKLFSCLNEQNIIAYPEPANNIEREIDVLLFDAETALFGNNFREALFKVERADNLIPLTEDKEDYRKLRTLFDKAIITACLEGPGEKSSVQFSKFESLLSTKTCSRKESQNNLFDKKGHWPILGSDIMSTQDCIDAVDNTTAYAMIAAGALNVNKATTVLIESTLYTLGNRAKKCCTENGFWKTCLQPVVDVWKRMDVLGIPPDPYWD